MTEKIKKPYSKTQKKLWIIAGSEISALEKCPNEYNRHANIGLMILITSFFAGVTSFVAGSTFVKGNLFGIIFFSLIWSFLIFALDRSMVNSIKKDPEEKDKFKWGFFWPRLVLAFILAFFMSIPLDHIVFKERIDRQMSQNVVDDWKKRKEDLTVGYNIEGDSAAFKKNETNISKIDVQISRGCEGCPLDEYKSPKNQADGITNQELPPLLATKRNAEANYSTYFQNLRRSQTPEGEPLISARQVQSDGKLRLLYAARSSAQSNYNKRANEAKVLYDKANTECDKWKKEIQSEKERIKARRDTVQQRLDDNTKAIKDQSEGYKNEIEEMRGFDTKFVTLFLMPNWGVQILKWLIFLVLLVIEILPTYLKLRTPFGQYDWEMHKREQETEIESKKRIESLNDEIGEIENYRSKNEIDLNKKLIDKLVVIEEKLANEMLEQWEIKARNQMEKDMGDT